MDGSMPVITGTLTSLVDGSAYSAVLYVAAPGLMLLASSFVLFIVLIIWLFLQKFRQWALLFALFVVAFYLPFALSGFAFYWLLLSLVGLVLSSVLYNFSEIFK